MNRYIYGLNICFMLLHGCCDCMLRTPEYYKVVDPKSAVISIFDITTRTYPAELIEALKKLPSLHDSSNQVYDVREIEKLIIQQARISMSSLFVEVPKKEVCQFDDAPSDADHNY